MCGWYGGSMALRNCYFETERLVVGDWSRLLIGDAAEVPRDIFVASLLTEAVTRDLPPGWQGPYDTDRAASWFAERQGESTVLVIADRTGGQPLGLLILSESRSGDGSTDIRLGYVIAENSWGRGVATEVVAGIADWCRANGTLRSIIGGIADGNSGSARVLQKNGFVPRIDGSDHPADEVEYILTFTT